MEKLWRARHCIMVPSDRLEDCMQIKRRTLVLTTAAMIVLAPAAYAQEIVKIGVAAPTSGSGAHFGQDVQDGALMAIDELNAKGVTIAGKKVTLQMVPEDDAGDPKQGTTVAQKLVDEKVNGVVGHFNSGVSIPASKVYSDAGIPMITPGSTNPKLTRQGFKTVFRTVPDDALLGGALGKYASNVIKGKSIAVIDDRTAYGRGVAEEFEKAVKAAGGKIADQQFTNDKATDFTAILTEIKAKKPDIVFFGGMDAVGGQMIRQMKQLGINAKFMGGDGICSTELPKLAGGAMSDGQVVCVEGGGLEKSEEPGMEAFRARFKKKFSMDVQQYAPNAYDAVGIMVAAMVKAGSADPKVYLSALAKTTGYKGVIGTISFDDKGDMKNPGLTLYTFNGGKQDKVAVMH